MRKNLNIKEASLDKLLMLLPIKLFKLVPALKKRTKHPWIMKVSMV
jgi:hypothetical protein